MKKLVRKVKRQGMVLLAAVVLALGVAAFLPSGCALTCDNYSIDIRTYDDGPNPDGDCG